MKRGKTGKNQMGIDDGFVSGKKSGVPENLIKRGPDRADGKFVNSCNIIDKI